MCEFTLARARKPLAMEEAAEAVGAPGGAVGGGGGACGGAHVSRSSHAPASEAWDAADAAAALRSRLAATRKRLRTCGPCASAYAGAGDGGGGRADAAAAAAAAAMPYAGVSTVSDAADELAALRRRLAAISNKLRNSGPGAAADAGAGDGGGGRADAAAASALGGLNAPELVPSEVPPPRDGSITVLCHRNMIAELDTAVLRGPPL